MLAEKVACGIDRLNTYFGNTDWQRLINRDTLCIEDYYECVLAQLFGSFGNGRLELGLTRSDELACGFDVDMGFVDQDKLTAAWLDALP